MRDETLINEVKETKDFITFLEKTGRIDAIDQYKRTPECIHVLEDFFTIVTKNQAETTEHLNKVNREYEHYREHALKCERCQLSLDSILLFKGYNNQHLFPKKIQKILGRAWEYDKEKRIYIGKLPAPHSGTFSNKARLVYITSLPIQQGVEEFIKRIQQPLDLNLVWDKQIANRRTKNDTGVPFLQANAHHRRNTWHTYLSIRSRYKS